MVSSSSGNVAWPAKTLDIFSSQRYWDAWSIVYLDTTASSVSRPPPSGRGVPQAVSRLAEFVVETLAAMDPGGTTKVVRPLEDLWSMA